MRWIDTCEVDSAFAKNLHEQLEDMSELNGNADDVLAKLASGEPVRCIVTKYAGATEAEDATRVMAPVVSREREYNREIDPETGAAYGWQEVGDFLTFHESKAGHSRYAAVCLTRHAEDPENCLRSQRLDRIAKVLISYSRDSHHADLAVANVTHMSDTLTVRNRI